MRPLRWMSVVAPVIVVAIIELVSDGLLDEALPFPIDTIVVVAIVALLAVAFSTVTFRRIDRLSAELRARNSDLERREASARALHRASVAVASLDDLDEVLTSIVDQARLQLAVDLAVLVTHRPDGAAYLAASSGSEDGVDPAGDQPVADPGSAGGRFVRPEWRVARLEAPLQRAGETIGLLLAGSRSERGFRVDEVEMLSSLANLAALAIENARLQARLRELAVVAERERIAREMHDGLAQVLGYVNTKSQAVEELLIAGRVDEARVLLTELAAAARSIYVDVREAILGLRSPVVPGVGLVDAVREYADRFTEASKIPVQVDASDDARRLQLAPGVETQMFRIIQEALTNVRKHASASRALIRFAVREASLELTIEDDGRGIGNGSSANDRPHYGLSAMRERAEGIGAVIDWRDAPGGGLQVHLVVEPGEPGPVRAEADR